MFKFENFNTPATSKSEDFRAVGGKSSRTENRNRGGMSVNEALDITDEDQAFENQTSESDREDSIDDDLDLSEFINEPVEVKSSLQKALQAEIAQLKKVTSQFETETGSDSVENDEALTLENIKREKSPGADDLSEDELRQSDIAALEQELEAQSEFTPSELKMQIKEINTLVQNSQIDSKSAERQVADLEQQIYAIESKKAKNRTEESVVPTLSDKVIELAKDEASEKSPELSQWRQRKVGFKQAEKEYYEALSENANFGSKWFGLGREDMNPQVKEAYDKFMTANTDFYKSAQENGVYDRVARFASRKSTAEQAELSAGTLVAERHIFKPAEERLDRQTSSLAMPEGIRNLKAKIAGLIKNHKVAAGLTGGIALTAAAAFAAPALATMAAGATVGFATKYATKKLLTKSFVTGREKSFEEQRSTAINMVSQRKLYDVEALENEIFAANNSLQQRKTAVNTVSRAAGIGGALAAGGFTADALADNAVTIVGEVRPKVEISEVSIGPSRSYAESFEPSVSRSWGQVFDETPKDFGKGEVGLDSIAEVKAEANLNETPDYSDVKPEKEFPTVSSPAVEEVSVSEAVPSAFEKVEAIHTIAGGENLSSVLFNHLNTLVDNGLTLPEGVGEAEVARYMYESFPEFTSAPDAVARLTPEQWVELGVESGNPNEVYPGETVDMNALVKMMNESSIEATLETPMSGVQEVSPSAVGSDITWWGDQSDMRMADEAAVENNAGIQSDIPDTTGPEATVPGENSGWENADTVAAQEIAFKSGDFESLLETIGSSHDFKAGPTMWNHLLGIMDEMSFENKQKYFEGLVVDNALGVPVEQDHYAWLKQNMPETGASWMDLSGPDRLTPEQWKYAGVPTGDPQDLTGAVLDHSKLFDVLFNKEFDITNALSEPDVARDEVSDTLSETAPSESVNTLETADGRLPEIETSAEGIDEIRSQLQAIKEKFANPGPDGTVSTNARELAIRAWDGGDFTLYTAPATTGDGANDGMLNSFRKSIAEGSSGGQEFFGSTLKKEIWVQPDGSVQEIHFKPGGGVSFAGY